MYVVAATLGELTGFISHFLLLGVKVKINK